MSWRWWRETDYVETRDEAELDEAFAKATGRRLAAPKETTSRLRHLDVQGWYEELTRIYKLSVDHDLWLADVLPGMFIWSPVGKPGEATETTIGYIAGPTAKFVVNVNMPDANIHAEFKQWLEEVRKQIMPPVAKPGQYALNSEFDTRKFGTWQSEGIIQFADLLAWRATLGPLEAKRYPDWLLGRWLKRRRRRM